jgi:hypothetical protein
MELAGRFNTSSESPLCANHSSIEHFLIGSSYSSRPIFVGLSSIGRCVSYPRKIWICVFALGNYQYMSIILSNPDAKLVNSLLLTFFSNMATNRNFYILLCRKKIFSFFRYLLYIFWRVKFLLTSFKICNSYFSAYSFVTPICCSMGFLRNPKAFLMVLKIAIEMMNCRFILFSSGYEPLDSAIQSIASSKAESSEGVAVAPSGDSTILFNDRLFCFSGLVSERCHMPVGPALWNW